MVWVSDVFDECYNVRYEIDPDAVTAFSFSADLVIEGGANASVGDADNLGLIDYRVENCVGEACEIVIQGLELSYMVYAGTYYDDMNDPFPFSIDGISIGLSVPVRGTITPSLSGPPVVAFPSEMFGVSVYTGDVQVDSVSLGAVGPITTVTDQVTGTYSGGVLTLDIAYESVDATLLLTLTTL